MTTTKKTNKNNKNNVTFTKKIGKHKVKITPEERKKMEELKKIIKNCQCESCQKSRKLDLKGN